MQAIKFKVIRGTWVTVRRYNPNNTTRYWTWNNKTKANTFIYSDLEKTIDRMWVLQIYVSYLIYFLCVATEDANGASSVDGAINNVA